ncbi:MAG: histone deacetylase family protein [Pseudomonadota bacterium]
MRVYTHEIYQQHQVADGHPECPARLGAVRSHLQETGLWAELDVCEAPRASAQMVLRAHPQHYLAELEDLRPAEGVIPVDPDTWLSPRSLDAAFTAVGAVCAGVEATLTGTSPRVFCLVRPPGHHAEVAGAMGFCFFNSIAAGALHALAQPDIERVAIVDFDVHHGNGTVDIFRSDPRVLVCSSFQHPHYPNRLHDVPGDHLVYTPLAAGTDSYGFRRAIETSWVPAIEAHQPQVLLISAGFDAHERDPLANINLQTEDYAWITDLLTDLARRYCAGRIVSALEGGYDLSALADSVATHLQHLGT